LTRLCGGKVASVEPGTIADEAGILPGDLIISINGHPLYDIIDVRFYSAEEQIEVAVRRGEDQFLISVDKDYDEPLGAAFQDELFDGVRTCGNRCIFCFVHQLPRGMRRSLYLKDDDYRLSFLHGDFVTLTNVSDRDMGRIVEQRLSPLYVSVHSTEPELRSEMLRGRKAPDVIRQLGTLGRAGITIHTQIVICPGTNDGPHLERTIRDLSSLYPGVASIGIVPVGLTRHRQSEPAVQAVDADGAREIVLRVRRWQREFKRRLGTRLVWASDELYLLAGLPVPSAWAYEGFPQIENGIGLVRRFLDDARRVARRLPRRVPHPIRATIVTSTLAAPLLDELACELNRVEGLEVRVQAVRNEFFGETVTVAGLLTGGDIRRQLSGHDLGDLVILPAVMLREGEFLDDVRLDELESALETPVIAVRPTPGDLAQALVGRKPGTRGARAVIRHAL